MSTSEVIYCVVTSHIRKTHLSKVIRHRESEGYVVRHRHGGLTLCGAKINRVYPYIPAEAYYHQIGEAGCSDCIDKWLEDQQYQGDGSAIEAVSP